MCLARYLLVLVISLNMNIGLLLDRFLLDLKDSDSSAVGRMNQRSRIDTAESGTPTTTPMPTPQMRLQAAVHSKGKQ